jgi:signal transduction histidine kinase
VDGSDDDPLATALERRLNRLRFDLHDGPQQEVHLLAQDLRLFREQLGTMIEDHPDRDRALGRLDDLEAQQIAVLSIVRESLSNVRRHSEADNVEIVIDAGEQSIVVEVRDDGGGFAPEVDGPAAVRRGRLGLVGMRERTEMLGGHTEIHSAPGGPTVVSAALPRWPADPA